MKIIGDQTPALKPWLDDNEKRLLDLFNDYHNCQTKAGIKKLYVLSK